VSTHAAENLLARRAAAVAEHLPEDNALLCDLADIAARLGISLRHAQQLRVAGKLPLKRIKFGRAVRYSLDECTRWIAAGCPATERWAAMQQVQTRGGAR
jgi:hypothetical protein